MPPFSEPLTVATALRNLTGVGRCGQNAAVEDWLMGDRMQSKGVNPCQGWRKPTSYRGAVSQYLVDTSPRNVVKHAQTGGFMFQAGGEKTKPARNLKRKSQTLSLKGCATFGAFIHAH